ncbi:MAG: hypothetical protein J6X49_01630 [Victivallales bacterium]|nr:hypothetical protein [Victivallales bacterium]
MSSRSNRRGSRLDDKAAVRSTVGAERRRPVIRQRLTAAKKMPPLGGRFFNIFLLQEQQDKLRQ